MAEATLKHSKDQLATEKKNQKTLQKVYDEDQALLEAKKGEVEEKKGAYISLQDQSKAAEKAVHAAQQRFQAVTAGLSSSADGQEETLAAQKIGMLYLRGLFCMLVVGQKRWKSTYMYVHAHVLVHMHS